MLRRVLMEARREATVALLRRRAEPTTNQLLGRCEPGSRSATWGARSDDPGASAIGGLDEVALRVALTWLSWRFPWELFGAAPSDDLAALRLDGDGVG